MSKASKIDRLLEEIESLRDEVQPGGDASLDVPAELIRARYERSQAVAERDAAVAELAKVKADIAWTMKRLIIRDILFSKGTDIPCAEEGWLPLSYDPEDTHRIEWINANCRVGITDNNWLLAIPHHLTTEESIPTPYNFRHIIDLSRGANIPGQQSEIGNQQ